MAPETTLGREHVALSAAWVDELPTALDHTKRTADFERAPLEQLLQQVCENKLPHPLSSAAHERPSCLEGGQLFGKVLRVSRAVWTAAAFRTPRGDHDSRFFVRVCSSVGVCRLVVGV